MNIQIFGSSKSFDTKKRSGGSRSAASNTSISTSLQGIIPREYQSVKRNVGFAALVNAKCRAYEDLYMAYLTPDAQEGGCWNTQSFFATPIVRNGKEATVGYCPDIWAPMGISALYPIPDLSMEGRISHALDLPA